MFNLLIRLQVLIYFDFLFTGIFAMEVLLKVS